MQLERVTAELRPRGAWEAADFGYRLARAHAGAIYATWFAVTLPPLALAVLLICFTDYGPYAVYLYWWLEPLYDAPLLHIVSRELFGQKVGARDALRALPGLARRNLVFVLTPYRFHVARSIAMPLTQLEGLGWTARRARGRIVNQGISGHGFGLTAMYQHFAGALGLGTFGLVALFVPAPYLESFGRGLWEMLTSPDQRVYQLATLAAFYVAQTALEPWFVGGGFGLYVNRRTRLEGWDIELAFRRIAERRQRAAGAAAAAACLAAVCLAALGPQPARAADEEVEEDPLAVDLYVSGDAYRYLEREEAAAAAGEVLAHPDFDRTDTVTEWRPWREAEPEESGSDPWAGLGRNLGRMIAFAIEFGLWIALAMAVLIVFLTRRYWQRYFTDPAPRDESPAGDAPVAVPAGDGGRPDDVPGAAMALWRDGHHRAALATLYRGAVALAVSEHHLSLPASATEGDCVRAVSAQAGEGLAAYFSSLATLWQRYAYGDRLPGDEEVEAVCRDWRRHFGAAA